MLLYLLSYHQFILKKCVLFLKEDDTFAKYLTCLKSTPPVTRILFIEISGKVCLSMGSLTDHWESVNI